MLYGIYGAGGCGRGIIPLLRSHMNRSGGDGRLIFIDDEPSAENVNGHGVWTFERFTSEPANSRFAALAIANSKIREVLDHRCRAAGIDIAAVYADNVVTMDDVVIGDGALLSPFVTLTSNIRIGRCFHANLYSYVEHDCVIGDYVTFAPGAHCNGNVTIGDHAYIGSGAMIRQNITIGAGAVIGMGAVVTKDVAPGVVVIGNPARTLEKK